MDHYIRFIVQQKRSRVAPIRHSSWPHGSYYRSVEEKQRRKKGFHEYLTPAEVEVATENTVRGIARFIHIHFTSEDKHKVVPVSELRHFLDLKKYRFKDQETIPLQEMTHLSRLPKMSSFYEKDAWIYRDFLQNQGLTLRLFPYAIMPEKYQPKKRKE